MLTALDPRVLRARACEQGARPLALAALPHDPLGRGSCLQATGLPRAALNGAFVSGATAEGDLRRIVSALGPLPALLMTPAGEAGRCAAAAAQLRLADDGEVPVMAADLDPDLAAEA